MTKLKAGQVWQTEAGNMFLVVERSGRLHTMEFYRESTWTVDSLATPFFKKTDAKFLFNLPDMLPEFN